MEFKFQISVHMNKGPSFARYLHMVSVASTHVGGAGFPADHP